MDPGGISEGPGSPGLGVSLSDKDGFRDPGCYATDIGDPRPSDHRQTGPPAMFFCEEIQLLSGYCGGALGSPGAAAGLGPNTTSCMMRPGSSVNAPAMTSAPRKSEIMAKRCSAT